jgi:crotonobetainyl-CoA:carnitine CoA-transferase CaiB-like acyl-CoA transferase
LCLTLCQGQLIEDPRFVDALSRFANREQLAQELACAMRVRSKTELIHELSAAGVPVAPLNNLQEVFSDPHIAAREMKVSMDHSSLGKVDLVGNPVRFAQTPVSYRYAPPRVGEHDDEPAWLDRAPPQVR